MPAPSAVVTVNGQPISPTGTSGIVVAAASTITVALVSVAGVETWDVNCTMSDGINGNGQYPQVEASKVLDNTHFTCQFTVPALQDIGGGSPHVTWNIGSSLQFVSVVNAGKFNQNVFTFGVFVLGSSTLRLVFDGENLETNATYGVSPDINEFLIGRALGPAGIDGGGDLRGLYPDPYVYSISGFPFGSPVLVNTTSFLGATDWQTTTPTPGNGADFTFQTQLGTVPFNPGNFNLYAHEFNMVLATGTGGSAETGTITFSNFGCASNGLAFTASTVSGFVTAAAFEFTAGNAVTTNGQGGLIELNAGNGLGNGNGGDIRLVSGQTTGTNQVGGSIYLTTGAGPYINDTPGSITLDVTAAGFTTNTGAINLTTGTAVGTGGINLTSYFITLTGNTTIPSGSSFTSNARQSNSTAVFNGGIQVNNIYTGDLAAFNCNVEFQNGSAWLWSGFPPNAQVYNLSLTSDADHTLTNTEYNHLFIEITSTVSLTTTRNMILPGAGGTGGYFMIIRNATTGGQSLQAIGTSGSGFVISSGASALVWTDGTNYYGLSGGGGGSITWANDLAGSSNVNQYVAAISGSAGGGGTVPLNITTLQFASGQSTPAINQATTSSGSGQRMLVQAQSATGGSHNGGNLVLASGQGLSATDGYVALNIGGSTDGLILNATGVVTIANLSTGVVHSDSSGNLTSSLIVNADVSSSAAIAYSKLNLTGDIVNSDISSSAAIAYSKLNLTGDIVNSDISSSAAIAVSKLAAGTAGQILQNNGTPTPTWTTVSGDISITNAGVVTVKALQGFAVSSATPSTNQVLEWNGSAWTPTSTVSGVTWADDLAGSNNTNQWIAAISGNGGGGGTVPLNITTLQWANGQLSPTINQAALAATNTPAAGQNLTVKAQAGSNALSGNNNGGNGGNLMLASGTAGTATGSGTAGTVGNIQLQLDSTTNLTLTTGTITWADVGAINYAQTQKSGTGANNGANWTIQAQQGQQQSGSNANNNGGELILKSGTAGTGGSGAAGVAGTVILETGDSSVGIALLPSGAGYSATITASIIDLNAGSNGVEISYMTTPGVVHNNNATQLTSSLIVDADVSATAAIQGTKINPNFGTQELIAGQSVLGISSLGNSIKGSIDFEIDTVSSTYTLDGANANFVILADTSGGAFTITLTNPVGNNGRVFIIKDKKQSFATHNLTIARFGSELIDGVAASLVLSNNNQEVVITCDGTNWYTDIAIAWGSDLVNSTNSNQYVSSLSYSASSSGGTIAINGTSTVLQWASGATPVINQAAPASSSSNGTSASTSTLTAGAGGATTGSSTTGGTGGDYDLTAGAGGSGSGGTNASGGNGGWIVLTPGAGGAKSGSGTAGTAGTIKFAGSQNEVVSSLKTANYTVAKGDYLIGIGTLSGTITITLPASPGTGDTYVVSDVNGSAGSHTVTVSPSSGNINGASTFTLTNNYQAAKFVYTGSQWTVEAAAGVSGGGGGFTAGGDLSGSSSSQQVKTNQATTTATKTTTYTITTSDYQIFADTSGGAWTLTLPAPSNGMVYHVWDVKGTFESNNLTLAQHSSEKISGVAASRALTTNWGHWMITTNGTDWFVG